MSIAQDLATPDDVIFPKGDLYSDEPPLETDLHRLQMTLLIQCLELLWRNRNDFYASGNITIYYSPRQRKSEDFRGPDFFVVLGTERKPRKSWVLWEEDGKYPNVIIELLSDSTALTDKGLKKQIYQDTFRTPEYFWFDPQNLEFAGFVLVGGKYQAIEANSDGWLWSQQLELYLGIEQEKLRFFTAEGQLVVTPQELAEQEEQRAEQEKQRAEQEKQRSDRLAAKLRELGIDPDTIA
ncbi:Uma2 family endonuclease [Calothrix sp. FACHB-1219]|uniref:Uma2 family endonuclease n=1 Tax=unclassified Calothrix TaxID=2619626 RepID=UPI00168A099B|nr:MULTISPECIES: Uma2 family endonuclease [unclassified Calothrix]MBD2206178.1 Uma2 family endonuclease [Calothrix sp. FACHB-168]MBD2221023.1 Uma2 family endonuclease [Calothrix sp. FACHB-1219]